MSEASWSEASLARSIVRTTVSGTGSGVPALIEPPPANGDPSMTPSAVLPELPSAT